MKILDFTIIGIIGNDLRKISRGLVHVENPTRAIVDNIVTDLYAKFNNDLFWNEKALVLWKSDNNDPKNNNNNNNNLICIAPACRMTSEALADSSSLATECLTEK